mmetsp:Transcript_6578/g.15999  ORF Transcript_6578/g.15999 Transcript_6578/m.15999 type:complete len:230 (+) Transcript_6578:1194-1883(+)
MQSISLVKYLAIRYRMAEQSFFAELFAPPLILLIVIYECFSEDAPKVFASVVHDSPNGTDVFVLLAIVTVTEAVTGWWSLRNYRQRMQRVIKNHRLEHVLSNLDLDEMEVVHADGADAVTEGSSAKDIKDGFSDCVGSSANKNGCKSGSVVSIIPGYELELEDDHPAFSSSRLDGLEYVRDIESERLFWENRGCLQHVKRHRLAFALGSLIPVITLYINIVRLRQNISA